MLIKCPLSSEGIKCPSSPAQPGAHLENRITGSKITTADEPGREKRPGPDAPRPTCKMTKESGYKEKALSLLKPCQSGK